jgi:RNA polymerase sigma-70 factor (ECF subfamily)
VTIEEVYERYGLDLLRFLYGAHAHLNHQDCEDLLHQGILKAVARIEQFDPSRGSLRGWLLGILKNEVRMDLRRRARRRSEPMGERDAAALQPTVEDAVASADELRVVEDALLGLPFAQREALLMRIRSEGQASDDEIAARLGIAPGSVAVYRQRARERLRDALAQRRSETRGASWLKPRKRSRTPV